MISATTASSSISDVTFAAVALKRWRSRGSPPMSIAAPITSRMLPRIEPISDALTTSWRPSLSAKKAMMSSGALPNVTFRKPPMPGPERAASSSVARPISAAVGITPSAEVMKIALALACENSSTIAIGMNGTSRYGQPEPLNRNRRRSNPRCSGAPALTRSAVQQLSALLRLRGVVTGLGDALRELLEVLGGAGARGGASSELPLPLLARAAADARGRRAARAAR